MGKWLKRIGLGLVALLAVLTVVGSIYERMARRRATADFPAPGRLVDIGGRRLHLDCRGTGTPIVVLEAGLDMQGSYSWLPVHDSIAATTRTCASSRAGVMWSDDSPGPHNAVTVATDLEAALTAAGEAAPYVMVGHSLGGPYIMTFTKRYPDKVAGLVFVDASHPDQVARLAAALGRDLEPPLGPMKALAKIVWTGLPRLLIPTDTSSIIPAAARGALAAYMPTSLGPMLAEAEGMDSTMAEAGTFRTLGDRPLVVLTAMAPMDSSTRATLDISADAAEKFTNTWKDLHLDERSWSSRSEHILLPDATHYIQRDRPDVVIAAVRRVVDQLRQPAVAADSTAAPR